MDLRNYNVSGITAFGDKWHLLSGFHSPERLCVSQIPRTVCAREGRACCVAGREEMSLNSKAGKKEQERAHKGLWPAVLNIIFYLLTPVKTLVIYVCLQDIFKKDFQPLFEYCEKWRSHLPLEVTVLHHLSHRKILREPSSLEAKYGDLWSKFTEMDMPYR